MWDSPPSLRFNTVKVCVFKNLRKHIRKAYPKFQSPYAFLSCLDTDCYGSVDTRYKAPDSPRFSEFEPFCTVSAHITHLQQDDKNEDWDYIPGRELLEIKLKGKQEGKYRNALLLKEP